MEVFAGKKRFDCGMWNVECGLKDMRPIFINPHSAFRNLLRCGFRAHDPDAALVVDLSDVADEELIAA